MPKLSYREALNQAMAEEMRRDDKVVIFGEDVAQYEGSFKVTRGLLAEFGPERVFDTPISEAAVVGMAIGDAMAGLRPVPELMTVNFAYVAMDQILNHLADGKRALLLNNHFINQSSANHVVMLPDTFIVTEPFGAEVVQVFASTDPFPQMRVEMWNGFEILKRI